MRAMCSVPLRPGALASLQAKLFNPHTDELMIFEDKTTSRAVKLPTSTAKLLRIASKGKGPDDPLLTHRDGAKWDKDRWKKLVKAAVKRADLAPETSMYTLRQVLMVAAAVDMLTVAKLGGTSVRMIEKHYGHLRADAAAAALEKIARPFDED